MRTTLRALAWLTPGLLCLAASLPVGLGALLIMSDEFVASKPWQAATLGLVFGGLLLLALGATRAAVLLRRRSRPPSSP